MDLKLLLWTPPGPIDEILEIAALLVLRARVEGIRGVFDGASPELQAEGRATADELMKKLDAEALRLAGELRKKIAEHRTIPPPTKAV